MKSLLFAFASVAFGQTTLFEGARVIVDARKAPIENGAILVKDGRIEKIGPRGSIRDNNAKRVDLTGKTVIPALVDSHIHIGYQKGTEWAEASYTRENIIDQLNKYASVGVAAVATLGTDPGDTVFRIRDEQQSGKLGGALLLNAGRGFAAPNAGPNAPELKPSAYGVTTDAEARKLVRDEIAKKVDFIKVWVDDRGGTVQKLAPALQRSIIDEAHKHNVRAIAHVYYLDDAKELVRNGIDAIAHLVRDKEMDDELIGLLKSRNVYVMPNLSLGDNATRAEPPDWLNDALLAEVAPAAVIARLRASFQGRTPQAVERGRAIYGNQERSIKRMLAAGVRIGFGSDSGAARDAVPAYTGHRELGNMVRAGMTPAQALTAATVTSSEFLKLPRQGTLDPGKNADFLVLDGNPLEDIANTKRIAQVYRRGVAIR